MGYNLDMSQLPAIQIVSKQRVSDHGEVFTSEREVNAMLDLVKQETERIDSRFLEPACGTGNFLVEILKRKLEIVKGRYSKNQIEFERYSVIAISSIYGVDILEDNVIACRERLYSVFDEHYNSLYTDRCKKECKVAVRFILSRNILWGDALTFKEPNEEARPIIFSEWSAVNGNLIKRRDYTLANLLENRSPEEGTLFSDMGDRAFVPRPIADFPLTHFLGLGVE